MSHKDRSGKGNKRNKPEHDSSLEEEHGVFRRSKLVARTPPKQKKEADINMEEIKELLLQMRKEIKEDMEGIKNEIKSEIGEIRKDVKDLRREIEQSNEEVMQIKADMNGVKAKRQEERKEVIEKLGKVEERLERLERDKIRNRLVLTGIDMRNDDENKLKEGVEQMIEREMKIKVEVKKAYKLSPKRYIVEMNKWEDKIMLLKEKVRLRGSDIYLESELTLKEREIQKKIRDIAREEKKKGAVVRVRYQSLQVNGRTFAWNRETDLLEETDRIHKHSKN